MENTTGLELEGPGSRLIVEPFFVTVTVIVLLSFLLRTLIDRQKASKWISAKISHDGGEMLKLNELIKESRKIEHERNSISAQDHYAKWTKLNRRLDKLNDQIKELSKNIQNSKTTHVGKISSILLFLEKVPLYVLRSWYARTPVILIESSKLFNSFGFQRFVLNMPFGGRNIISTMFWCTALDMVLQAILSFVKDLNECVCAFREESKGSKESTESTADLKKTK